MCNNDGTTDQMGDNNASVAECNYSDVLRFGTLYYQVTPDVRCMSLGTLIVLYTVTQYFDNLQNAPLFSCHPVHINDIP